MENFTDLRSLYYHLEKNATDYKYIHEIGNLFQKLRDLKHKENKSDEAKKAQWETDFFSFITKDGRLDPEFRIPNDKGEISVYPSCNGFDDRTYEYLIGRLNSSINPLLKARYSQILWGSPKKHAKYAKIAVDSYLKLIKIYEAKDKEEPQDGHGLDILEAAKNAYSIAYQIKYKVDKIKSELRRLVNKFNFKSNSSFVLRADIIELMLRDKRRFFKEDFLGFEKVCWRISQSLAGEGNLRGAIRMLELGEKVDRKMGQETHNWIKKIAESYETLMKQAENRDPIVALYFWQYAFENYKKLKDKNKIHEFERKYSKLKNSMRLKEFKQKIDLTEHLKRCREVAERVVQNDPDEIIRVLMLDKNLLPTYKDMEKSAEKHSKEFVFHQLLQQETVDQSGHLAQHFSDEDEKEYSAILQEYNWGLELDKIHLIREIFFAAIRENKLSTEILLGFLNRYSWFGKNISKKLPNNETIKYNWLNLLAPALHEYFLQMYYYFLNPTNFPNLVLGIDSLTLKMEGLLRDICHFSGIATFYQTKDSKGRDIVREKNIHALLYEEHIKKLFDEDDLLFFKFLLVEKAGYNLRHKVAHSLMFFQEYTIDYMHLLILALLRLGKYDFVKTEDVTSDNTSK